MPKPPKKAPTTHLKGAHRDKGACSQRGGLHTRYPEDVTCEPCLGIIAAGYEARANERLRRESLHAALRKMAGGTR